MSKKVGMPTTSNSDDVERGTYEFNFRNTSKNMGEISWERRAHAELHFEQACSFPFHAKYSDRHHNEQILRGNSLQNL